MSRIAIIVARGGSKRIPRKNIKQFLAKPIIAYSIAVAKNCGLFDEVMVSTEDQEIADIAQQYGAALPFLRSFDNADDFTGPGDVVHEVLANYKKKNRCFSIACCIYATAPLITVQRLEEAYNLLMASDFDMVFPVVRFDYPIWRSFNMNTKSAVSMNFPEFEKKRSQDLPPAFHDAGQFYWFHTAQFEILENKNVFGINKGAIEIPLMEAQDIDNEEDWQMAELKAQFIKEKYKNY